MAAPDIDAQLAALADMTPEALRERWSEVTSAPVPRISADLLRLALAYALQAACYGGLARHTEQRLRALARGGGDSVIMKPGARLVREWNGVLHTVTVGEDGQVHWNGKEWNSLSQVARAITGTRWSGPAFFGLKGTRQGSMMAASAPVRCAIYTRKSSEEGLEQDFNSLHAQAEACAAYVLSQASEGWTLLPGDYDDGGLSGGTLERPALKRLLADIAAGKIDIVVVYKVDRLTRSLIDFARLVEAFDAAGTSFVSVTQSFNTTTSMGRLTLNMLLSFAQFEREVTAERIRDKIAASKAKGMWMGGTVPLGYRAHGRSLAIVEKHASLIRHIHARYLALGNVRSVAEELEAQDVRVPTRRTGTGKPLGGGTFSRGQVNAILTNPVYAGLIAHKGKHHPGQHPAIIAKQDWDKVQAQLAGNRQGRVRKRACKDTSVLAGRIVDEHGEALVASHASKRGGQGKRVRYRYYVSRALQHGQRADSQQGLRLPAAEVEAVVASVLAEALDDPLGLAEQAGLVIEPQDLAPLTNRCRDLASQLRNGALQTVLPMIAQVEVHPRYLELVLDVPAMARHFAVRRSGHAPNALTLRHDVRLTRTGRAMRLIDGNGASAGRGEPDAALVRLVLRARGWSQVIARGEQTVSQLARHEGVTRSYLVRVLRLAFLSPKVIDAMLEGNLRAGIDASALTRADAIDPLWHKQERMLLAR